MGSTIKFYLYLHSQMQDYSTHFYVVTMLLFSFGCKDKSLKEILFVLSLNNSCFQCNIAITNFLGSYMCELRFHDIIGRVVYMLQPICEISQFMKWLKILAIS